MIKEQKTKRPLLERSLRNGLYEMKLIEATPQSYKLLNSISNVHRNKSSIDVDKADAYGLHSRANSAHFNVFLAAKNNVIIWHAKLGHPSPLILKKSVKYIAFSF